MNKQLIISDSIAEWLEFQNQQKQFEDDILRVTLFLKLEEENAYSYFLFLLRYRDHIWIATDMLDFDNPRNKFSSRRPERRREHSGHWENVQLPYEFIQKVPELRKKRKTVAIKDMKFELLTHPLGQFPVHQRFYIILLVQRFLVQLEKKSNQPMISTLRQYTDQLLLTEWHKINTDPVDTGKFFAGYSHRVQERAQELLATLPKSTALAKRDVSVVLKSKHYDPGWLAAPEKQEGLAVWLALEENREALNDQLNLTKKESEKQTREMKELLQIRLLEPEGMRLLFVADELLMEIKGFSDDLRKEKEQLKRVEFIEKANSDSWASMHVWTDFGSKQCRQCCQHKAKLQVTLRFCHYNQFVAVLGLKDRFALPRLFQNYRTYTMLPYEGNSILDNVHPYTLLKDPLSASNSNGFWVGIWMCGICARRYRKQYREYAKAIINTKGEVVDAKGVKPDRIGGIISNTLWRWSDEKDQW